MTGLKEKDSFNERVPLLWLSCTHLKKYVAEISISYVIKKCAVRGTKQRTWGYMGPGKTMSFHKFVTKKNQKKKKNM